MSEEQNAPESPQIPDVVATVGGQEISSAEFQQHLMQVVQRRAQMSGGMPDHDGGQPTQQDLSMAMSSLVDQTLVSILVQDTDVSVEQSAVDEAIAEIKTQFPDEEQFNTILAQQRMSMEELNASIQKSLVTEKFVQESLDELTTELDTSDVALQAQYDKLKEEGQLNKPATADVAHILIQIDDDDEADWTAGKEKIDAARERIVEGKEDFGAVAGEVTDDPGSKENGGLYKNVPPGQMVPEFDKLTFELPVGEVSDSFKTQFGWHILQVADRSDSGVMAFDEVKSGIKDMLKGEANQEAYQTFIASAKEKIGVEIHIPGMAPEE